MTNEVFIRICESEEMVNVLSHISGLDLSKEFLRYWLKEECKEDIFFCHKEPEIDDLPY